MATEDFSVHCLLVGLKFKAREAGAFRITQILKCWGIMVWMSAASTEGLVNSFSLQVLWNWSRSHRALVSSESWFHKTGARMEKALVEVNWTSFVPQIY